MIDNKQIKMSGLILYILVQNPGQKLSQIRIRTPEPGHEPGVSINWSSWEQSWTEGVLTQSWAEIQTFEDGDPQPVPRSLTEERSVRGRIIFNIYFYQICQTTYGGTRISCSLFVVRCEWIGPIFQPIFQV